MKTLGRLIIAPLPLLLACTIVFAIDVCQSGIKAAVTNLRENVSELAAWIKDGPTEYHRAKARANRVALRRRLHL